MTERTRGETWYVYQLRGDTGLLYVGYTRHIKRRLGEHRRTKPWWPEVTGTRSQQFATEDEARQREKEIWAAESPKYNKRSPFLTTEERNKYTRQRVKEWVSANRERRREYGHQYWVSPLNRAQLRATQRAWAARNRPTTVAGRRTGRWRQSGPGLF